MPRTPHADIQGDYYNDVAELGCLSAANITKRCAAFTSAKARITAITARIGT